MSTAWCRYAPQPPDGVTITATTTARDTTEVRTALTAAVTDRRAALDSAPKVKVKTRDTGGSR